MPHRTGVSFHRCVANMSGIRLFVRVVPNVSGNAGIATVKLSLAGSVADYTSSVQNKMKSQIAAAVGCLTSQITLKVAAGSVIIMAAMPSSSAAKLVALISSRQLTTLGGHTVTWATLVSGSAAASTPAGR